MSAYPLENDVCLYMKEKVVCIPENKIKFSLLCELLPIGTGWNNSKFEGN